MSKKLAEKFLNNQTTPAENEVVLEWFETTEGQKFLLESIEHDKGYMDKKDLRSTVSDLDSEKLYSSIQEEIRSKKKIFSLKSTDWLGYSMKAAAAVLVIITATLFTIILESNKTDQVAEREPVIFQTEQDQHREITLGDGSVVRLNENSEIVISEDFLDEKREITLTGEAYFDIVHKPESPFIIQANQSSIEVLGTSFNVRSISGQDNVQVVVEEGKVSFSAKEEGYNERPSVILSKGQYGYMDLNEGSIQVDEVAIDNYFAWKSGRFVFDDLTLQQVCTQLNRLYELECGFEGQESRNLSLTANFSNESLDKTLSVIALTLNLEYERNNNQVKWIDK
ncbi:FecR family protein [Rhodohalobacter sp. SW132]|uniref:FecR family protein n=1 Tax=Rhodohalobacter sp. SW132 TaxID=2293433 RepID=UPI00131550E6|nr:FecR family protein [Rhodohalobacter sp. SW132]